MKKLLTFILILLTLATQAQQLREECGTKVSKNVRIVSERDVQKHFRSINAPTLPYCVKTYITVFADNDGSNRAESDANILRQFQNMVNQFQSLGICFMLINIRQINNSDLNIQDANDEDDEIRDIRIPGCLNIFIHKELTRGDKLLGGTAYDIPNNDAFLSLVGSEISSFNTITTMAHETGHVFGLYHTFETLNGAESVARTGSCKDCEDDGDYICDTPADPNDDEGYLRNNTTDACVYTGTKLDECDMLYTPAVNNIMTYGKSFCRNTFTAGQGTRMTFFLATESGLQNILTSDNASQTTPYTFSSGISWSIARDSYTIQPSFGTVVFNGTVNHTMQSKKVTLGPGTQLSPNSGGKVVVKTNPYCN